VSLHQILETLIHHTTFRTEAEHHQALDLLDSSVDHDDPAEGAIARTTWQPPVPTDSSGAPITVPTGMTSAQADELISLMKAQQGAQMDQQTPAPPEVEGAPLPPPISTTDVPEGVK
jgi:hypothetical protein